MTTVFLVRSGETAWRSQARLLGRKDVGISDAGRQQAARAVSTFSDLAVEEIISSPLQRAMETAAPFAARFGVAVTRDQRLTDVDVGRFEGEPRAEVWRNGDYERFIDDETERFPDGEKVAQVHARVVASIEQAGADNDHDANIVIVSHSAPIRIALAHYLGMAPTRFHRLRVSPGSVSALRFGGRLGRARVLAINAGSSMGVVTAGLVVNSAEQ